MYNYTNAYMLMYRKVGLKDSKIEDIIVPDYVAEMVDVEEKAEKTEKKVIRALKH